MISYPESKHIAQNYYLVPLKLHVLLVSSTTQYISDISRRTYLQVTRMVPCRVLLIHFQTLVLYWYMP